MTMQSMGITPPPRRPSLSVNGGTSPHHFEMGTGLDTNSISISFIAFCKKSLINDRPGKSIGEDIVFFLFLPFVSLLGLRPLKGFLS